MAAVRRPEIVAERAEDVVAVTGALVAVHLGFREVAQVPGGRQRHVLQRQPDQPALAGETPVALRGQDAGRRHHRSEEHTSELQSLMRISYAVFCLKKKK